MAAQSQPRPIFVVGAHRSGTTLLRFMLSAHPALFIPPESDFIPRFFRRRPTMPRARSELARILRLIFTQYRFAKQWRGPHPAIGELLQEAESATPARFLDALYGRYAAQYGARRWGDKTPIYSDHIPLLNALFPDARILHLIRDGRDVALSTVEAWGRRKLHIDLYSASRLWARRTHNARRDGMRLGANRYLELRYEELVADPEPVLHRVCDFLEEDFAAPMLEPHELAARHLAGDNFHAPVRTPPHAGRINRWRRTLSAPELRLVESVAAPLLTELGYEPAAAARRAVRETLRRLGLTLKYHTLYGGRAALTAVGLLPPN